MTQNKKPLLAAWQMLPSPQVTIAMATLGFDWVVIDLEHASITTQEAESICIAAEQGRCKPFVRLPNADPYLARRMLDAGAAGLIVPVVESKEAFDDFAQHCFYPPRGKRGLGLVRANLWGGTLEHYINTFKPILIAQIETVKGAKAIHSILESSWMDGIMIGPYDLSASLGKPGQFQDAEFLTLKQLVAEAVKHSEKLFGFHQVIPDEAELKQRIQEGYDFIAYGTDIVAIRYSLKGVR